MRCARLRVTPFLSAGYASPRPSLEVLWPKTQSGMEPAFPGGWRELVRAAMLGVISWAPYAPPAPPRSRAAGGGWFADMTVDAESRPLLDDRRPGGLPGVCRAGRDDTARTGAWTSDVVAESSNRTKVKREQPNEGKKQLGWRVRVSPGDAFHGSVGAHHPFRCDPKGSAFADRE